MEKDYYIQNVKIQKSLKFLFPLIGFKKSDKIKPDNTFLYWSEADYSIDDYNLLVYYKTEFDEEFKNFERNTIITKDTLVACHFVDGGMLYIFDLITFAEDIGEFMEGQYGKFKYSTKNLILTYYGEEKNKEVKPGRFVHMGLFPELYKKVVAEELGQNPDDLDELITRYNIYDEWCHLESLGDKMCDCKNKTFYL